MTEHTFDPGTDLIGSPATARGRTAVLINAKSGTVRSMGAETVRNIVETALQQWPGGGDVQLVDGAEIDEAAGALVASGQYGTIVAGGGDGSLACVAGHLAGTDIALGILPLGTMNLMSKSLGIDPRLDLALAQLAVADVRRIDVGRAGRRVFLHNVSFGIQPRMVRTREKLGYRSRLTKMLSGARAMVSILLKPQSLRFSAEIDGRPMKLKTPALLISNNLYEDSMWLRQAQLDGGVLGLYAVSPMSKLSYLKLAFDLLRGRWRANLNVYEEHAKEIRLTKQRRFGGKSKHMTAALDGEIVLLPSPLTITIDRLVLKVLTAKVTSS